MSSWFRLDTVAFHGSPAHVPSSDRHTLPLLYKFGLKRTVIFPVVRKCMWGGRCGYVSGIRMSKKKQPQAYGVPSGGVTMTRHSDGALAALHVT